MCEQSCSLIVPIRIVIIFAHKQHKTPLVHYYRKQQYARFNAARLNLELKKHSRLFSANINLAVTQKTFVRSLDNKTEIQQSRRRALLIGGGRWGHSAWPCCTAPPTIGLPSKHRRSTSVSANNHAQNDTIIASTFQRRKMDGLL